MEKQSLPCETVMAAQIAENKMAPPPLHKMAIGYLVRRRRAVMVILPSVAFSIMYFLLVLSDTAVIVSENFNNQDADTQAYHEEGCGCARRYPSSAYSASLCSSSSSGRGPGQKVVSYTIYGSMEDRRSYHKYWGQIEDRIKEVNRHYPDWIMRLYHNISAMEVHPHKYLCLLYCKYPNFDLCYSPNIYPLQEKVMQSGVTTATTKTSEDTPTDKEIGRVDIEKTSAHAEKQTELNTLLSPHDISNSIESLSDTMTLAKLLQSGRSHLKGSKSCDKILNPKMWRFLPMVDPGVSEFLIRDVDSSILAREVAAVNQWLNESSAILHVMRDHPMHNGPILAGMWGGSRSRGSERLKELFLKMVRWPPRDLWDYDQRILQRVVWPEIKDSVMIHDSYFCRNKLFTGQQRSLPFPTRREGTDFVSWGILRDPERAGIVPCPTACRPKAHRDWVYC